jgi:putative hydrolase of HD superfamily
MEASRLQQQLAFILEIDRLKEVLRRSYITSGERRENSAEHSWHLCVMALILAEHSREPMDALRLTKMLIVHDIVEIDAGDTFCYDDVGALTKTQREEEAARRIFGLLPPDQEAEVLGLWQEFEARETPEARFAAAIDRLMPLLHNFHTKGRSWQENGVTRAQVEARNAHIAEGSLELWHFVQEMIEEAARRKYFVEEPNERREVE